MPAPSRWSALLESRRRHPTDRLKRGGTAPSLAECIAEERELLAPLREQEHVIDTSDLTPGQLRAWIRDLIQADVAPLVLTFESFAYKRGVPRDADLVFDVLPAQPLLRPRPAPADGPRRARGPMAGRLRPGRPDGR